MAETPRTLCKRTVLNDWSINLKKVFLFYVIMFASLGAFTVLLDLLLGLFGFPSETKMKYVHPSNYTEIRKSIDEFEYEFSTNSQGLRYKEIPFQKKSPTEQRILIVGDSFTEGYGVKQNETFSSQLESFYSFEDNVYFINAGLAGTGPLEYMYALFKVGVKYDIDGVLICLHADDNQNITDVIDFCPGLNHNINRSGVKHLLHFIFPRIYTLLYRAKERIKNRHSNPKNSQERDIIQIASEKARKDGVPEAAIQSWVARVPRTLLNAANKSQFNGAILAFGLLHPNYYTDSLDIETESANQKWHNMKSILDFMINECRARGIEVGVVFTPSPFQHNRDFHQETNPWVKVGVNIRKHWLTDTTKVQQNLNEWSQVINVPYLDLTDEFRKAENTYDEDINYPLDSHWTPLGHRIAAEAIRKWLNKTGLLQNQ